MKFYLTLLFAILFPIVLFAQNDSVDTVIISQIALNQRISVLNDRFYLMCPDSAVSSAGSNGIMSAKSNENAETRIIFDLDEKRMVLFTTELYSFSIPDLYEYLTNIYAEDRNYNQVPEPVQIFFQDSTTMSVMATPCRYDNRSQAILINSLWVQCPDSTLVRIDAYLNPPAMENIDEYLILTENIFNSLEYGDRVMILSEREETHNIFDTATNLVFAMPEKYVIQVDNGYDFKVFNILPLQPIDKESFSKAVVYVGAHPSWLYQSYGFSQNENSLVNGTFLEKKMKGFYFENPYQHKYLMEYQGEANKVGKGMIFHVILMADSKESLEELRAITEQIKLEKQ